MNALEKIRETAGLLAPSGIEEAGGEAELLVRAGLNIDAVELYRDNPEISSGQIKVIDEMVQRRCRREPLQYIIGEVDFLGLRLSVGEGVLIPRPETELMGEQAVKIVESEKENSPLQILDLCTGSGCLALLLADEFGKAEVVGIDISGKALVYARKNAQLNNIKNVSFLKGHLFEPVESEMPRELFDFIISNPPYVHTDEIGGLQPEVSQWEPVSALDGGAEGLDFYGEIVDHARGFLKDNGIIMFELGFGCADGVSKMFENAGYTDIEILKDLAGIERIIKARWIR